MPLYLDRHTPSPGVPEFQRRFGWLVAIVALAFLLLVGRLWQLQLVRGETYYKQTTDNFVKAERIPAVRGLIMDRRGVVLVDNRPAYNVYVTPRYLGEDTIPRLARLLGLTPEEEARIREKIGKARHAGRYQSMLVLEDIDFDRMSMIEQAKAELPGVDVQDVPHRNYLYGTLAGHVLGYMNQLTPAELEAAHETGYEDGDYVGRYGIEKEWEHYLRGKKGHEIHIVDARGRRKSGKEAEALASEASGGERKVDPVPGQNVVLTIDVELQRIAERALRNHPAGGIAVVDVRNGKILALVSKPSFDPNVMTGHLTRAEEAQMEADPYKPFLDKTLRQHYYPGSTYKFVTAIAGLEAGLVTPDDEVLCKGWHEQGRRSFRCTKQHGRVRMYEALAQSCNVYFWELAEKVGMDRIGAVARDFGFGAPTGLGLNGDVPGRVPWKAWYEQQGGFRIGYTLNTAIGQGDTEVTVLQLALAYAAVANGGNLWVPQLVERIETPTGKVVQEFEPRLRRRVQVAASSLIPVQKGLWGVVNDPKGTAFASRPADLGVAVAGKTGTAQVRKLQKQPEKLWHPYRDHAWFAGYAPADDPKIAIVVLVEHGGKGGHVAAPVAMEIVRGYFEVVDPPVDPAVVVDARAVPDEPAVDDEGAGIPASVAPPPAPPGADGP